MSVVMMSLLTFALAACCAMSSALLLAMFSSCTKEIAIIGPDTYIIYSHHQDRQQE